MPPVASKAEQRDAAAAYRFLGQPAGPMRAPTGIPVKGLALAVALSFCLAAALMVRAGLTIRVEPGLLGLLLLYAGVAGAVMGLRRFAWSASARAWSDGVEYITLFASICIFGALASYPIAADSRGFFDVGMERFDRLLGFDWLFWYELVAHHPVLQAIEREAYENIFLIPAVILGFFAATGRRTEAMRFITGFWLAAMMTLGAFYLVPTRGPLALLLHGNAPYMPISALYQAQIIPELRDHQLHNLDLAALHGLVGAPSFHATSAVLFIAAAWSSKLLRWPLILFSVAMLLATPIEGTHYLCDILAGAVIALIALAAAAGIERRCLSRPRPHSPQARARAP